MSPQASHRTNQWIQRMLRSALRAREARTAADGADAFLREAAAFAATHSDHPAWYADGEVRVLHETTELWSVEVRVAMYRGLNHANEIRRLATFDLDGHRVELDDVARAQEQA